MKSLSPIRINILCGGIKIHKNTVIYIYIYHAYIFNFYIIKLENPKKKGNPARICQFKSTQRTINHVADR